MIANVFAEFNRTVRLAIRGGWITQDGWAFSSQS